ncbi:MAG TPA: ATP-binding cassette domain-containing protein, partial [Candidatus Limnocylindrales bacterium]|nr:ATP-binding cassette domain-containing protein [Candidatus Limnocylindrales bacterium]
MITDATPQPAGPATDAAPPILTVEAVTKTYGEGHTAVTAVHEASMQVSQGELVSLLGPSGSGKTTLISMIGGLLTPTSGLIQVG